MPACDISTTARRLQFCVAFALALVSPGASAGVGPEPEPNPDESAAEAEPDPQPEDPVRAKAERLYREGAALYSAAEYDGAIAKFTDVLEMISGGETSFDPDTRGSLLFNLATAHDRAYNVDGDIVHLRKARELYARIVDEASIGYNDELVGQAETARDDVAARLSEVEAELEAEAAAEEEARARAEAQARAEIEARDSGPDPDAGRGLIISGAAVAGLGVAASSVWIAGIAMGGRAERDVVGTTSPAAEADRIDAIGRGRTGNTLGIVGGVVSGAFVVTGAALLVTGLVKRKRARMVACAPAPAPNGGLVACALRF